MFIILISICDLYILYSFHIHQLRPPRYFHNMPSGINLHATFDFGEDGGAHEVPVLVGLWDRGLPTVQQQSGPFIHAGANPGVRLNDTFDGRQKKFDPKMRRKTHEKTP